MGKEIISGIYRILNSTNNKVYIGSAKSISKRFWEHKYNLKNNNHANIHLQLSWNKYGEENFIFEILEKINNNTENIKEVLLMREQYWIDITNCTNRNFGYNICLKSSSRLGSKNSIQGVENVKNGLIKRWENSKDKTHISTLSQRIIAERGIEVYITSKKLNKDKVLEILKLFETYVKTKDIANTYKVSWTTINDIKLGKKWSSVTGIQYKKSKNTNTIADTEVKELGIIDYIIGQDCELDEII